MPGRWYNLCMPTQTLKNTRVLYTPSDQEVEDLIKKAEKHPLGLEYLKTGACDSVAATFEVHAFVLDKARERLLSPTS